MLHKDSGFYNTKIHGVVVNLKSITLVWEKNVDEKKSIALERAKYTLNKKNKQRRKQNKKNTKRRQLD